MAFAMAISEGSATSVAFLPEGVALTFAILFGARVGPGIFLGQFLLSYSLGVPLGVGAAFGLVNTLEDLLGGYLFWRLRISPRLERPRDVARLFMLSALLLQPAAAALKAIPRLAISSPDAIFHLSLYSWAGNTMGQFLVAPLLLTWCSGGFRFDGRELRRGLLIVGGYFLAILAFKVARLGQIDPLYWLMIFGSFYLVLIWAAVQSRVLTTSITNLLTTMGLLWVITSSPDSLLYFSTQDRVLYTDVLILGGIVTALLISALFGQLGERTAQLQRANAAKERVFTVIGHDLRSPLAGVQSGLDLLKQGYLDREGFTEFREVLSTRLDHVHRTLENLMAWGESQLNDFQPRPAPVSLAGSAADATELFRQVMENKRIQLRNEIPTTATVFADPHHLDSILRNLLSNAVKFTPEAGRITLTAAPENDHWRLSVTDTGVGLTAEQIAEIQQLNHPMVSTPGTDGEAGLGLGLRIVQEFIAANHGQLRIESTRHQGSHFHVRLPRV